MESRFSSHSGIIRLNNSSSIPVEISRMYMCIPIWRSNSNSNPNLTQTNAKDERIVKFSNWKIVDFLNFLNLANWEFNVRFVV